MRVIERRELAKSAVSRNSEIERERERERGGSRSRENWSRVARAAFVFSRNRKGRGGHAARRSADSWNRVRGARVSLCLQPTAAF